MALPLLFMLAWRSETHGGTTRGWFDCDPKLDWILSALRDRWKPFDVGSLVVSHWSSSSRRAAAMR